MINSQGRGHGFVISTAIVHYFSITPLSLLAFFLLLQGIQSRLEIRQDTVQSIGFFL
jgi:hypothetical protein